MNAHGGKICEGPRAARAEKITILFLPIIAILNCLEWCVRYMIYSLYLGIHDIPCAKDNDLTSVRPVSRPEWYLLEKNGDY